VPQVSIEFEVADASAVAAAAEELTATGLELLHDAREEPWDQTVARLALARGLDHPHSGIQPPCTVSATRR
jgi:hypothetical protein